MLKAGFSHVDITPPVGTHKIGWLKDLVIEKIKDPLFARMAVFEDENGNAAGAIQLDTLSVRWTTAEQIRAGIEASCGIPGCNVMVAATHNHAGPATSCIGDVKRDENYVKAMVAKIVEGFGEAWKKRVDASIGYGHCYEFKVSHNRRTALRDGTTVTHAPGFSHSLASHVEGPIDPQVGVLAAKNADGRLLGAIVNFACHPTHCGGTNEASGGYPEALCAALAADGCPEAVFLNGACGNISPGNPYIGLNPSMEEIGRTLAEDAMAVIAKMEFEGGSQPVYSSSIIVDLPVRKPSPKEVAGKSKGAQRFVDPAIYDRHMPEVLKRLCANEYQPAEVQALRIGPVTLVSIPAEYFTEFGLFIKENAMPVNTLVVSCANGMLGYVPTELAFKRGGYETTFADSSRMGRKAGQILADNAVSLVDSLRD